MEKSLDKDIEILKELNESLKQKPLNCDVYIREDDIQAIENVLADRETWKKIAEKLAEEVDRLTEILIDNNVEFNYLEHCQFKNFECMNMNIDCEQCIIDWAKSEVDE